MAGLTYFTGVRNQAEAKARYRDLAMEHHPDRATQIMQAINAEYDRVKSMSDAELRQFAETMDKAVSHLPRRERDESGPTPESAQRNRTEYVYWPTPETLAAIAEQQRLAALNCPAYYTIEQRQSYDRWQQECARRVRDIDLDHARWQEQEECEREQAEARAAIARAMR